MALSNAERQAKWRAKRNKLAKEADAWYVPRIGTSGDSIRAVNAYWDKVEKELEKCLVELSYEYAMAATSKTAKDFGIWLATHELDHFGKDTVDALVTLGREVTMQKHGTGKYKDPGEAVMGDLLETVIGSLGKSLPRQMLAEWERRKDAKQPKGKK